MLKRYSPDHHFDPPIDCNNAVAQVAIFLGIVCHVIMGMSRMASNLVLGLVSLVLRLGLSRVGGSATLHGRILDEIPLTIDTALKRFDLDGKICTYAVCTQCHCTYKPTFKHGSCKPIYPESCGNIPIPGEGKCGAVLIAGHDSSVPLKTFAYHSFHDWLAGLLSHAEFEEAMDGSKKDFMASLQSAPEFSTSVFDSKFLRTFNGPHPGKLFMDEGDEGRYAFTLNVDFFNIEGMSVRGAKTSCGIISMACLNLPAEVRYKPQNLYLAGIVPGPKEPNVTQLNHYLRPLVDDLLISWERGVRFSRTALHRNGRKTRCAVAASVNDLPGARKLAALAGVTSRHDCTICKGKHKDKTCLGRHDYHDWERRDVAEMRKQAEAWKNASTSDEQNKIFEDHGTRWSEMWRLPYWDPTHQLVIDAMHCILEGLVQFHFRHALKLSTVDAKAKQVIPAFEYSFRVPTEEQKAAMNRKELTQVKNIHIALTQNVEGKVPEELETNLGSLTRTLFNKNRPALEFVAADLGISFAKAHPSKVDLANALTKWVSHSYR
jgi:hypothetical protein